MFLLGMIIVASTLVTATVAGSADSAHASATSVPLTGQYTHCDQFLGSPLGVNVKTHAVEVTEAILEIVRTSDPHVAVGRVAISDRGTAYIELGPSAGKDSFEFFHVPYPTTPPMVPVIRSPVMPKWLELRPCSGTNPHVP